MTRLVPFIVSLAATLLFLATQLFAQDVLTGRIIYDETVKMDIQLPPGMESMKDQIPSSRTTQRMLLVRGDELLMRDAPEPEDAEEESGDIVMSGGGATFVMRVGGGGGEAVERIRHTSLADMTAVEQRDFMGRAFLITEEVHEPAWQLTSEQSMYEGYLTMKATTVIDSTNVVAWFTPEIPVSGGPGTYGGLPGLILVLDVDDGKRTYAARSIELGVSLPDGEWVRPDDGKKVTRAEYNKIVEEKMKEMGAQRRGGGTVIFGNSNN